MSILPSIEKLFPRLCFVCDRPFKEPGFVCPKCKLQLHMPQGERCLVCDLPRLGCPLCRAYPASPTPAMVLTGLEPTRASRRLLEVAYTLRGWRSWPALSEILWTRYLLACSGPVSAVVALADHRGVCGSSYYHRFLARYLGRQLGKPVYSWRRACFARPKGPCLLVGWQMSLAQLIDAASRKWLAQSPCLALLGGLSDPLF